MNMFGVAVASDTVLTVTRGGESKIVPNASKIIELGSEHKVLVLSSGDVLLNDFPHELHLTEWAKTLHGPLPRLEDYVRSYKRWSSTETKLATLQSQTSELIQTVQAEIDELVTTLWKNRQSSDGQPKGTGALHRMDRKELLDALKYVRLYEDFEELDRASLLSQLESNEVNLSGLLRDSLSHLTPAVTDKNMSLCYQYVAEAVGKDVERQKESTIGFVGMGSEESFARMWRMRCSAIMCGGLLSRDSSNAIQPPDNTGRIHWFAQADRIEAFLRGFHPSLREMAADHLESLLESVFGMDITDAIWHRTNFLQKLEEESNRIFINPLFSTLDAFSVTELASFADSLLASQLVSSVFVDGLSTAGGVVEVATIDSRNGVIWHRKLPKSRLSSAIGT